MEALINTKQSARLLRIDIDNWSSAVARQHDIRRLPTVWLYNGSDLVTSDMQAALTKVNQLN